MPVSCGIDSDGNGWILTESNASKQASRADEFHHTSSIGKIRWSISRNLSGSGCT